MRAYASRTGTRRNLAALRAAGWGLFVSAAGVHRHEGFLFIIENGRWSVFRGALTEQECDRRFQALLAKLGKHEQCEGIIAPDIVCGGTESLRLSLSWLERLLEYGPTVYLPVQPGITPAAIAGVVGPRVGVFVGGDSEWKESTCHVWASFARERGALCHVGRVNTLRRLKIAMAAGAHSFDGSGPSRYEKSLIEMEAARAIAVQFGLEITMECDCFYEEDGEVWCARVTVRLGVRLDVIMIAAGDAGCGEIFEVQTDLGIFSADWDMSFKSWEQLEAEEAAETRPPDPPTAARRGQIERRARAERAPTTGDTRQTALDLDP